MKKKSIQSKLGFFLLAIIVLALAAALIFWNRTNRSDNHFLPEHGKQPVLKNPQTLIVGSKSWNGNFNPVFASTIYDAWATTLIFDSGLMTNDLKGKPVKWMASDYQISKDGKSYLFTLKKGIKFSNGNEVTARDFELTYLAMSDPGYDGLNREAVSNLLGYEQYHNGKAADIQGIQVVDDYTIRFTEKKQKASALLEDFVFAPLDHHLYSFKKGDVASIKKLYNHAVGAGPYLLLENKPENHIIFKKNPFYWHGAPKIDRIKIQLTDSTNELKMLENGEINVNATVPCRFDTLKELKKYNYLKTSIYPANSYGFIGLNLRNPKFSDQRVRQALMYGLNRKAFIKNYYHGYGSVCNEPMSTISWAYTDEVKSYEYNPDEAARLLDAAGWILHRDGFRYRNGEKLILHWRTYTGSEYVEELIPQLTSDYHKLGIEVVVEKMQFSTLADKIYQSRDFEMYNMAWGLNIDPDPSSVFSIAQDVPGGGNAVGYRNPESERLIREGQQELSLSKRKEIYKKWLQLLTDEVPYLFVSQGRSMVVYDHRVRGLEVGPYNEWTTNIEKVSLESK